MRWDRSAFSATRARRASLCRWWGLLAPILVASLAPCPDSASAQSAAEHQPAAEAPSAGDPGPPPLQFLAEAGGEPVQELATSHEGYAELIWVPDPAAEGYRVLSDTGHVHYEGRIPQAFVSGLRDGTHRFRVVSLDRRGEVLREGPQAISLTVQHWSLALTWTLLGTGAVVMAALVAVLVIGSRSQRKGVTA